MSLNMTNHKQLGIPVLHSGVTLNNCWRLLLRWSGLVLLETMCLPLQIENVCIQKDKFGYILACVNVTWKLGECRDAPLLLMEFSLDWMRGELSGLSLKLGDGGSFSVGVSGRGSLSVIQGTMLCCLCSVSGDVTPWRSDPLEMQYYV